MPDQFFLTICGICSNPNAHDGWWVLASQWFVRHGYAKEGNAQHFAYGVGPLSGPIYDAWLAEQVIPALKAAADDGLELNIIGHSNGCKIIGDILFKHPEFKFRTVHYIAAAEQEDCDRNGLNRAARIGQIGKINFFVSPVDEALDVGALLGYGKLGKAGPQNVSVGLLGRMVEFKRNLPHSGWVSGIVFEWTMQQIAATGDSMGGDT